MALTPFPKMHRRDSFVLALSKNSSGQSAWGTLPKADPGQIAGPQSGIPEFLRDHLSTSRAQHRGHRGIGNTGLPAEDVSEVTDRIAHWNLCGAKLTTEDLARS